jgi:hypothetical protein
LSHLSNFNPQSSQLPIQVLISLIQHIDISPITSDVGLDVVQIDSEAGEVRRPISAALIVVPDGRICGVSDMLIFVLSMDVWDSILR